MGEREDKEVGELKKAGRGGSILAGKVVRMICFFCGKDDFDPVILVPTWQPDGSLAAFACLDCSKSKGLYCEKHERPHIGFDDQTTACVICIEELVKQEGHRAHKIATIVRNTVGHIGRADLAEAAEVAAMLTGGDEDIAILRFVASRALRNVISIDEVVGCIMREQSPSFILAD